MTTLYDIRGCLDLVHALHDEGRLTKHHHGILKRALNKAAFDNLLSRAKSEPAETIYREIDATGFQAIEKAINRHFGFES